ncbi:MAG: glycogen synthase GlgA [Methylococcales symbiont of Iophon sp. n. MRB-2018]|nr:MAG: glycogen synthase GlgA [Methylococcales symbiont of Iophon sp. n. MRB-2018]KAF3979553.1 MAG: glycogen synthase GlgA [Methylococcales symbiont of Iophon sp. n. MRB-2018]
MKKILFASSEVHPLIKTGGLADVAGSLPRALAEISQDIRVILPNYSSLKKTEDVHFISSVRVNNQDANILETRLPDSNVIVWLVDCPALFDFPGNPYVDETGNPWENIADRFALFSRIIVEVAMNRAHLDWQPNVVHCNDWQTGLVPALLSIESNTPSTVFTIHNMAYQGMFPESTFADLNLPRQLWHPNGLEYHEMLSFIKGGLAYADRITTVSPTYALEIQTPEYGYGLEGLLSHKYHVLSGIINGMDLDQWNPEADTSISEPYSVKSLEKKAINKTSLQARSSLPVNKSVLVFGLISRLVEQKGVDLLIDCLPEMVEMPLQLVLLGSGDKSVEQKLMNFARLYPKKISVTIGYDESLAHQIEAGVDVFLMPSRFEPCGLNQMYSQRYGTIPIVRETGGLVDTIEDALPKSLANNTATGVSFKEASGGALLEAIKRTMLLYNDKKTWKKIQTTAMGKDFSWKNSAEQYLALYEEI